MPKALNTIGDHIRAWRINNNLLQKDIAKMLQVTEDTITGWENGRVAPGIRQIPKINQLLGYLPVQIDTSTFGGEITYFRYLTGLTPKEFGALVKVDASTVRSWESKITLPKKSRLKQVKAIVELLSMNCW